MPNEGEPKNKPRENLYVPSLGAKMAEGFSLEEVVRLVEEEIEKSKSYDTAYNQHLASLKEAVEYLRSEEKK